MHVAFYRRECAESKGFSISDTVYSSVCNFAFTVPTATTREPAEWSLNTPCNWHINSLVQDIFLGNKKIQFCLQRCTGKKYLLKDETTILCIRVRAIHFLLDTPVSVWHSTLHVSSLSTRGRTLHISVGITQDKIK